MTMQRHRMTDVCIVYYEEICNRELGFPSVLAGLSFLSDFSLKTGHNACKCVFWCPQPTRDSIIDKLSTELL